MKKLLQFLLFAALMVPIGATAQVSCPGANVVTVSNADTSSTTTSYFPGYSLYNYSYSEVIVPAEEMTGMGTIRAMQFKPTSTAAGSYFTNCEVYLALTTEADLSAGWSTEGSSAELVWEGDMSYTTTDWQTLVFDTPFAYDGTSNLLVIVRRNHGSWTSGSTFAAFNASAQLARYAYRDGSAYTLSPTDDAGTATSTVGWYKFIGCDDAVAITCFRVRDVYADNITTVGATIHWIDTNNTNATYTIYNMADTSVIATGVTDTFYTITTFSSNTVYSVGVVANCAVDDNSSIARVNFRTACGAIDSLPWTEDFNGYGTTTTSSTDFIPCWARYENGSSHYPIISSTYARSGNGLYYYHYNSTSYGTKWLVALPVIDTAVIDFNTIQLKFWARTYSASYEGTVQVGVMTDFYDEDSFIPLETISLHNSEHQEYTVSMLDAPEGAVCMAFKMLALSSTTQYVIIDDVTIEPQPTCPPIVDLTVEGTTTGAALLSWGYQSGTVGTPESYNLGWINIDDSTATAMTATSNNTYFAVTGLTPSTNYSFWVTPNCGENDGMGLSDTINFRTTGFGCAVADSSTLTVDTVGRGTITNTNYFPTNSCYNYALGQQIFTAAEIGHGGQINSIAMQNYSVVSTPRVMEIYMGHTPDETSNNFIWDNMTLVFSGSVSITAGEWITFELETPFNYNGSDNLVILCRDLTGSYQCSNYWYLNSDGASGCSRYIYQDSDPYPIGYSGGTSSNYRNNIVFNMSACAQLATCSNPQAMINEITSDEAVMTWIPGAVETEWNVYYRVYGDTVWTEAATGVSTTSYTFSDLIPGLTYEFRVVNPCTEGTFEDVVSATTACAAAAPLPLTEDFQTRANGNFNRVCWVTGSTFLGSNYPMPYVTALQGAEDNMLCLFFNGGYMVLPHVDEDLNQLEISFKLTQGADSVRFLLGLLPEQDSPIDSIIVLDTMIRSVIDTSMATVNYSYRFDTIAEEYNGYCVAFWDAFNDNYSFLDDIVLDYIPACGTVSELSAVASATDVTISWGVSGDNASSYTVEYGPRGFTPGTGTTVPASGSPITITGLNHSTSYDAYVYSECATLESTSAPSQVVMFTTDCMPYTTFPYFTDFENIMPAGSTATDILPNCWMTDAAHGNAAPYIYYTSSVTYTSSPTHCLYFSPLGIVALPQMGVPLNTLMLTFHEYNSSPSNYGLIIGAVNDADTNGLMASFEPIDTVIYEGSGYQFDIVSYLTDYTGTGNRIALKNYYVNGTSSYSYHYIDDLTIDLAPTCIAPQRVQLTNLSNTTADLEWVLSQATNYNIEYGPTGFTPGTGATTTSATRAVSLTGLTPFTTYDVRIVGVCSATDVSDTTVFTFTTMRAAPVTTLPYICTFADSAIANAWELVGEDQDNTWFVGSAEHHGDADMMGLYIGNGTDTANYYNVSSTSFSYAYRVFTLDSTDYAISFDWKGYGEGNYDYLRAFLAPSSFVPQAGKCPDGTTSAYSFASVTPAGMLDLGGKMNLSDNWNSVMVPFHIDNPGNYTLMFFWANDGSAGTQPPACVDNVKVFENTCPWPENIHATAASTSSLSVDWTDAATASTWQIEYGPAGFAQGNGTLITVTDHPAVINGLESLTSYDFYVRAICSADDTGFWSGVATLSTSLCDGAIYVDNFTEGSSDATSSYGPIGYSLYDYSYVQTIIPAEQLEGLSSEITAFSFLPTTADYGDYFTNMTIYMANIDEDHFTSGLIYPDSNHTFVMVADSMDLTFTEATWQLFSLETPFQWDGVSNVLFAVKRDHGEWSSSTPFRAHTDTVARLCYAYRDNTPFDITDNSYTSYTSTTVGDLRLVSCPTLNCDVPVVDSVLIGENDVFVRFSSEVGNYEVAIVEGAWDEPTNVISITDTFYTFTGLTDWTAYTVGVRAVCGATVYSEWVLVPATTLRHPCAMPTGVTVSNPTFEGATVSWTLGEAENQWEVRVFCTSPQYEALYTVSDNPTVTVTGLDNGVTYSVTVRAMCDSNWYSEWTEPVALTTTACPQVTNVNHSDVTATSATISWTGTASSYEIEYGKGGFPQGSGTTVTVTSNSVILANLEELTTYDVYVRSVCSDSVYSLWSTKHTFSTPEETGIDDVENGNVALYPNPASTTVTVSGIEGMSTVTVVDLNGRVVFRDQVGANGHTGSANAESSLTIDVSGYAKGAYFVRITGERTTAVRKLVVR